MKPNYVAVGDKIHAESMTGGKILNAAQAANLLNGQIEIIYKYEENKEQLINEMMRDAELTPYDDFLKYGGYKKLIDKIRDI